MAFTKEEIAQIADAVAERMKGDDKLREYRAAAEQQGEQKRKSLQQAIYLQQLQQGASLGYPPGSCRHCGRCQHCQQQAVIHRNPRFQGSC